MSYTAILERFHGAILDNDSAAAEPDIKKGGRMSIYIEGYRIRLLQAIRNDYPGLLGLLGDERFDKLALAFIEAKPPESFNLDRYPHVFAHYLTGGLIGFEYEIAMLESMIARVFMEDESVPLSSSAMEGLTSEAFGDIVLKPRTASRLVAFEYPVSQWFDVERAGSKPEIPSPNKSYLYIYRHRNNVQRFSLSEAAFLFLTQLFSGSAIGNSLEHVLAAHPQYEQEIITNIQLWFPEWLKKGFFRIDT